MTAILVAGVGNIFLGDDGFGSEVARRLTSVVLPEGVRVADFGIRGIHLAYDLLDRDYSDVILVDAVSRGGKPGTLYTLDLSVTQSGMPSTDIPDAHGMNPETVIALVRSIVPQPPKLWLVGCEPERCEEEMALSEPVRRSVDQAVEMVQSLIQQVRGAAVSTAIPTERMHHA